MAETTTMLPLTTVTTTATTTTPTSPTTSMGQVHPTTDVQIPLLNTEDNIVTTEHRTIISSTTATNPSIMVSSNETTMLTTSTIFRLTTIQGNYRESQSLLNS